MVRTATVALAIATLLVLPSCTSTEAVTIDAGLDAPLDAPFAPDAYEVPDAPAPPDTPPPDAPQDAGTDAGCTTDEDDDGHLAPVCGGDDCDDLLGAVHPGAAETCDGVDQDCDSAIDDGATIPCWADTDGDEYAAAGVTPVVACVCPAGSTDRDPATAADCDDGDPSANPASAEVCDGDDEDCDSSIDEELGVDIYPDCDSDGFGSALSMSHACALPSGAPPGCAAGAWTLDGSDCDDARAATAPGAAETCNGIDDDCTGTADEPAMADAWCVSTLPNVAAARCTSGACGIDACASPYLDCTAAPGCETDGSSDPTHCGSCGTTCGLSCIAGACDGVTRLTVGGHHTCAARASGIVMCWGDNRSGALGDGTLVNRTRPVAVVGLLDGVEASAGGSIFLGQHSCARRAGGTVACWGYGMYGQLGDGGTASTTTPVPVSGLTDAVEIAVGGLHSCARRTGGTVACWGQGSLPTPSAVAGLSDAVEISGGGRFTCARRAGGTVVCWGDNSFGQFGNGTTASSTTPVPVSGLSDAAEIATGTWHACARRAGGTVVCWGENGNGALGDGTTTDRFTPVTVSGLTDAVEIAAGAEHTCARRAGGTVVCWGFNAYGEIGDGTTATRRLTPAVVSGLTDAVEIASGQDASHTCARRAGGGIVCWGNNAYGQLGDGSFTSPRRVPVAVVP